MIASADDDGINNDAVVDAGSSFINRVRLVDCDSNLARLVWSSNNVDDELEDEIDDDEIVDSSSIVRADWMQSLAAEMLECTRFDCCKRSVPLNDVMNDE